MSFITVKTTNKILIWLISAVWRKKKIFPESLHVLKRSAFITSRTEEAESQACLRQ